MVCAQSKQPSQHTLRWDFKSDLYPPAHTGMAGPCKMEIKFSTVYEIADGNASIGLEPCQ